MVKGCSALKCNELYGSISIRNFSKFTEELRTDGFCKVYNFFMFGHQFSLFCALPRLYSKVGLSIGEGACP